ncbi:MAG: Hpt domain-containing protein [Silicimonas sp.]|nr:Hpt domain-containing protein [Silicimonas sp.]
MIDLARLGELREEVGSDDLVEVVELFCNEVEETLARIRSEDAGVTIDDFHFLKGSALNIGLSDVGRLCQEAEHEVRDGSLSGLAIQEIEKAFSDSRMALVTELARLNVTGR